MPLDGLAALRRRQLRRFALFGCYELGLAMGIGFTWLLTQLVDPLVVLVSVPLRILLVVGYVRWTLRPLAVVWRVGSACDDDQLRAATMALHLAPRRAAFAVAFGWATLELLWLGLGLLGPPLAPPFGTPETVVGALFAASAPGFVPITELLVDATVAELRAELGVLARQRQLTIDPPRRSFIHPFVGTAVSLVTGVALTIGGSTLAWHTHTERAHTTELQQERLLHSASRVGQGDAPLPGIELRAQAPPELEHLELGQPVHVADIERGVVLSALALPDGRVLVSETIPSERINLLASLLAVLLFSAAPVFALCFWLAGRTLTVPIDRLNAAARHFVEAGEMQQLELLIAARNDEVGLLAASFAEVFEVLTRLSEAAAAVSSGDLSVKLEHPGELHDAFRGMLARLNETVMSLRETSLELASAAAEINTLLEVQTDAAVEQSHNIQQVAQTVSSLAASAGQIASAARGVRSDAEDVVVTTEASAAQIGTLREHTAAIAELLISISEVASRSDLLALNGSLEATRAGEAGRGFALVAAEMRRLAERIAGTVDAVRDQVADVEASSAQSVTATEQGRALAERTAAAARAIDELTAAQSEDTEHASLSVQAAADMVIKATSSMSQVRAATGGLHNHAIELERLLQAFSLSQDSKAS